MSLLSHRYGYFSSMKRVLITGANGFLGRHTLSRFSALSYEIHAVDINISSSVNPNVVWHQKDLLDSCDVTKLLAEIRPTHLLHLAWYAEPGKFWSSTENFRWLTASIGLLQAFCAAGGQRVVMSGTCAEYDWNYGFCSELTTPCNPATPYGVCKNALRQVLQSYSALNGLSNAWGRIFFMYGQNEQPSRLVSSVVTSLLRGERARCTHGDQIRDFMHVEDVAAAFVALLDSPLEGTVNIASGRPVTLREIVFTIANSLKARDLVQLGAIPAPENEPPLLVADIRRLTNELGWQPYYNLDTGIKQTVDWWKSQA